MAKTIGIIGGQGPASTADFYMRVIQYYQSVLGKETINEYPPVIIFSVPTPDLIFSTENEEVTYAKILEAAQKLEKDGCDFIVIACNSLQFLIGKLQSQLSIPIISMAQVVKEYCIKQGFKKVGILATATTLNKHTYQQVFKPSGIEVIQPNTTDQKTVASVISNGNSGITDPGDKQSLLKIIDDLASNGAEAILLACTELPLILKQTDTDYVVIDCNELYATKTARLSNA